MAKPKLKAVPPVEPKPLDMAPDIYAKAREEIRRRDWAAVHIAADRRAPITLEERRPVKVIDSTYQSRV